MQRVLLSGTVLQFNDDGINKEVWDMYLIILKLQSELPIKQTYLSLLSCLTAKVILGHVHNDIVSLRFKNVYQII